MIFVRRNCRPFLVGARFMAVMGGLKFIALQCAGIV